MSNSPPFQEPASGDEAGRLQQELLRGREDAEALALWGWLRGQSLLEVLRACLSRGDQVDITVLGGGTFRGNLIHVGSDLACLATSGQLVDLNLGLPVVVQVVQRATHGGRSRARQAQSFRHRLEEYEFEHQERPVVQEPRAADLLEVGSPMLPRRLHGHLRAVGPDVLYLIDRAGVEWYVPLNALTYVARPRQADA